MYIACKLFILMLGEVAHSMLFMICIDTALIIGFTYVVCKHDGIIGRVNADMWSVFWFNFILFIFDQGRCVPKYSSDSIASQKVKEKQADCRICLI
jgi:hypothetical protein